MKKVLATLVALSLPAVALADEHRGFYIQGDAGHASVKGKAYGESVTAKGFKPAPVRRLRLWRFPCGSRLHPLQIPQRKRQNQQLHQL